MTHGEKNIELAPVKIQSVGVYDFEV